MSLQCARRDPIAAAKIARCHTRRRTPRWSCVSAVSDARVRAARPSSLTPAPRRLVNRAAPKQGGANPAPRSGQPKIRGLHKSDQSQWCTKWARRAWDRKRYVPRIPATSHASTRGEKVGKGGVEPVSPRSRSPAYTGPPALSPVNSGSGMARLGPVPPGCPQIGAPRWCTDDLEPWNPIPKMESPPPGGMVTGFNPDATAGPETMSRRSSWVPPP